MMCTNSKWLTGFATVISPIVIIFIVLGFATDYWVETDVDREKLIPVTRELSKTSLVMARFYHSRHRGIIRECYTKNRESEIFLDNAPKVVDGNCFYINFDDVDKSTSSDYDQRMHILRSMLALYVLGMVAVFLTFFIGIALCCVKSKNVAHAAGIISFLGALFVLSSVVMFHAAEYTEAKHDGQPGELVFQNLWSKELLVASDTTLGYSYALAWVGIILAGLDGVLFILTGRAIGLAPPKERRDSSRNGDRQVVIRKDDDVYMKSGAYSEIYDNPSFFYGLSPAYVQNMPSYPAITYGNAMYAVTPDASDYKG